jgi:hypothetical protein
MERTMRELLVEALTSLAESHPYLLAASAFIGAFWLALLHPQGSPLH